MGTEGSEGADKRYSDLVWLLLTDYQRDQGYTPSKYLLETVKPKIEAASNLPLQIYDGTLYNFKSVSGFKEYFDLFLAGTEVFRNALIVLSFTQEKYISRDFYLANLAKQFTCWDTVYINCPSGEKISTSVFDFVIPPSGLPDQLTEIIEGTWGKT